MSLTNLIYASQLLEHRRFRDAEAHIREYLGKNPHDGYAFRLLAIAFMGQKRLIEAEESILKALGENPGDAANFYVHGTIKSEMGKHKDAARLAREAIKMDPNDADFYGLLAHASFNLSEYPESLKAADRGLALDAEHQTLRNIRAATLMRLDRANEAFETIQGAIEDDPEDDDTHATLAWALLEQGKHKEALEHFREALRINPENQYAKAGLVQALKAKYFVYRIYLKYMFWLQSQSDKVRWGVIIGGYLGYRGLLILSRNSEAVRPFVIPLMVAYLLFAWSTWVISPVFDLLLFLNPYGKYALKKDATTTAKIVGVSLAVGLLGGLAYLILPWFLFLMVAVLGLTMVIPFSSMFTPPKPRRNWLILYAFGLLAVGLTAIGSAVLGFETEVFIYTYLIGIFAYQWVAGAVIGIRE
ncbi:MAG: tetratricopeptide repeat protein [Bacteroidia bacterium]|nr:tetratricopeptide repeat protein [Bacteroidia bacterium]